jgi:hypothetical protein
MFHIQDSWREERADWTWKEGIAFIYESISKMILHELDETFLVEGMRLFNPHENSGKDLKDEMIMGDCEQRYGCRKR